MAGHHITLFDLPSPQAASRVAAGLYNIITGRHATLTWQARTLLAHLDAFFEQPPFAHLRAHLHPMPIYRPYKGPEDFNDWHVHSLSTEFSDLVKHCPESRDTTLLHNPLGGLEILPCGWADTAALIDGIQTTLVEHFGLHLIQAPFPYTDLDPATGTLQGHGTFHEIIFAEGVGIKHNPWFSTVDIRPLKGQILDLEIDMPQPDYVYLRKNFLIPKGHNQYTLGATYEQAFHDDAPTPEAHTLLMDQFQSSVQAPAKVTAQRAGLRPTSPDRRPIIGQHPEHPKLHVLNGMGTKGLLQAPWCARLMRDCLDGHTADIPKAVHLDRFINFIR